MQFTTHNSTSTTTAARVLFGCVAFAALSLSAQSQTYYYYPTSVPAAADANPAASVAQTGYWQRDANNQLVWYTYSPQYYQPAYYQQSPQAYYTPQSAPIAYQGQTSQSPNAVQAAPAVSYEAAPAASVAAPAEAGDAYGFLGWLNATRASYGLGAVGYDANLTNWAAMNNDQQAARGMGHFVMGPARRQNSAMGAFANIGAMWMNSPAHRAALLDPTITAIGIAGLGAYWTFNAY